MRDMVEQVAQAIEATIFAPHELPLGRELHAKYRKTAAAAINAMDQWRFEAAGITLSTADRGGE